VATAIEATTEAPKVSAFEGVAQGSNTIYMPSALCNFGTTLQSTAYAVQNTSTSNSANVTVTYKNLNNNTVATVTDDYSTGSKEQLPDV
jgi:hypothetical protein